ncbi:MAG TPA: crossover junction endodeoxyribonuclease RuvC [Anaerolineae bacterium]|nr:crossover junction endodeoxyribonuclease RuvC [Anaerolineae bacterium]MCB0178066.1 crossover junction endodeoxyribonuclease RuvC [Anaerolineae bacterium]MCB0225729.1 crossover junction endodeoxyribonuclease RuvC [Anaerolineae bacterium]MCB9106674.1 crossover junction endodeoxyribonuclease RuvC [Anaerolineales bacterium]HRV96035.1 crossover junction endodeoxyribonuclease RuvC [Anaerolineae bacterium]
MRVIGIDPGTAITGWGIVEGSGSELQMVAVGTITTAAGTPLPERLQIIYHELTAIIEQWQPSTAAIEELFFSKNAKTALAVGHGRGVAMLALANADLSITEYKPLEVKQAITGHGGADKKQMQQMVKLLLALDDIPRPDDAADALAIAICHLHSARLRLLE